MSDDLDEIDAALRRAMAALDGEAPAGYFEALPERTLARLDDPAIGELPDEPGRKRRREPASEPPVRQRGSGAVRVATLAVAAAQEGASAEPMGLTVPTGE